ncbi:MAG: DUF3426 domain-containing protein [Pseudomonadota bacterium]
MTRTIDLSRPSRRADAQGAMEIEDAAEVRHDAVDPTPATPSSPADTTPTPPPESRPSPRIMRARGLIYGAAILFGLFVGATGLALRYPAQIAATFPEAAPFVAAVHGVVPSEIRTATVARSVIIVDQGFDLTEDDIGPMLLLWGRVANTSPASTPSPKIAFTSFGTGGAVLQSGEIDVEQAVLRPEQSARFAARVRFPVEGVQSVTFAVKPRVQR